MHVCRPVGMQTCELSSKQATDGGYVHCPRIPVVLPKTLVHSPSASTAQQFYDPMIGTTNQNTLLVRGIHESKTIGPQCVMRGARSGPKLCNSYVHIPGMCSITGRRTQLSHKLPTQRSHPSLKGGVVRISGASPRGLQLGGCTASR